jgi:hypothetical protein
MMDNEDSGKDRLTALSQDVALLGSRDSLERLHTELAALITAPGYEASKLLGDLVFSLEMTLDKGAYEFPEFGNGAHADLIEGLSREQKDILWHTATRAAGGLYCGNSPEMLELEEAGLMQAVGKKAFVPDEYFRITPEGLEVFEELKQQHQSGIVPLSRLTPGDRFFTRNGLLCTLLNSLGECRQHSGTSINKGLLGFGYKQDAVCDARLDMPVIFVPPESGS